MPTYTVCTKCIAINENSEKTCSFCGSPNIFYANEAFIQEGVTAYFFAYQNRLAIEHFIKKHGSEYRPNFHQLGPSEILAFVALSALSGVTWDTTKAILLKIYKSAKKQNIRIRNEHDSSEFLSADEKTIQNLLANDDDLVTLMRYIQEYKDEYTNAEVHEFVLEESLYLNREIMAKNKDLLTTMRNALEAAAKSIEE